jgi:hypothetical protein
VPKESANDGGKSHVANCESIEWKERRRHVAE